MEKQVTSSPQYLEMGGGVFWLPVFTLLTPVDREPAINVDMVNTVNRYCFLLCS